LNPTAPMTNAAPRLGHNFVYALRRVEAFSSKVLSNSTYANSNPVIYSRDM
jgi:hypothetical protein